MNKTNKNHFHLALTILTINPHEIYGSQQGVHTSTKCIHDNGQGQKFFPWHILWSVKIHKKLNTHQIKVHNFNNLWHNICMKPPKPYKLSINVTCYGT